MEFIHFTVSFSLKVRDNAVLLKSLNSEWRDSASARSLNPAKQLFINAFMLTYCSCAIRLVLH